MKQYRSLVIIFLAATATTQALAAGRGQSPTITEEKKSIPETKTIAELNTVFTALGNAPVTSQINDTYINHAKKLITDTKTLSALATEYASIQQGDILTNDKELAKVYTAKAQELALKAIQGAKKATELATVFTEITLHDYLKTDDAAAAVRLEYGKKALALATTLAELDAALNTLKTVKDSGKTFLKANAAIKTAYEEAKKKLTPVTPPTPQSTASTPVTTPPSTPATSTPATQTPAAPAGTAEDQTKASKAFKDFVESFNTSDFKFYELISLQKKKTALDELRTKHGAYLNAQDTASLNEIDSYLTESIKELTF